MTHGSLDAPKEKSPTRSPYPKDPALPFGNGLPGDDTCTALNEANVLTCALFIDDERKPANDGRRWRIARTVQQVEEVLCLYGPPVCISFDHDLGAQEPTVHAILKAMVEGDMGKREGSGFDAGLHPTPGFHVHSQNPIGKTIINRLLAN